MAASYKNIIDTDKLKTGDFSNIIKKPNANNVKYIKGYAKDSAIEALTSAAGINNGVLQQALGISDKQTDAYDPYHLSDSKKEEFWYDDNNGEDKSVGRDIQKNYDDDTNTFKRSLSSDSDFKSSEFWYEDPFVPSFEIFFDEGTPFFSATNEENSFLSFSRKYNMIDSLGYTRRETLWREFRTIFWKIFENTLMQNSNRNISNKAYYITKIGGMNNLNKKMIKYGEDKITITMNEDVSMTAWYLVELYNNIVYSYKNQRNMYPENVLRFNMSIKINDMRNFTIPQNKEQTINKTSIDKNNIKNNIKNTISPKSSIIYTLHDCNFNFIDSRNYGDDMEIGGYSSSNQSPQTLSFDIFFKSVSRVSEFPLIAGATTLQPYEDNFIQYNNISNYHKDLQKIKSEKTTDGKGYLNNLLTKAKSTVANIGVNYLDNLETTLRESRGTAVNSLLNQFRDVTTINKMEPDNVYNMNFNDRNNISRLGKELASGLITDLENSVKNAANF